MENSFNILFVTCICALLACAVSGKCFGLALGWHVAKKAYCHSTSQYSATLSMQLDVCSFMSDSFVFAFPQIDLCSLQTSSYRHRERKFGL